MFGKTSLMPWRGHLGARRGTRGEEYPLEAFHREVDRLFDEFWRGFELPFYERPFAAMTPRMDMMEDEDEIRVSLELPGMDEKDVEVSLSGNMLTIKGEKTAEEKEAEKGYRYMERSYGSFRRAIPLDVEVLADKVKAKFDKGVLMVTLPKSVAAKTPTKKIPVHAGKVEKLEKKAA